MPINISLTGFYALNKISDISRETDFRILHYIQICIIGRLKSIKIIGSIIHLYANDPQNELEWTLVSVASN